MTRRFRRRAGAVAALTAALLVAAPVAPAAAAPVITVETPAEGGVVESSTAAVRGRAVVNGLPLTTFKEVTLTAGGSTFRAPCTESPCNFTWNPSFPTNGEYRLSVTAVEQTLGIEGARSTAARTFFVDAAPAKPVLDAPKITEARTVELSWTRNTEPDMLYYAVFRKDPGGATFLPAGRVNQPSTGRSVAFTDATTTQTGGDYLYQVVAVRKGGTKAKPETASSPSSSATAAVPVPPTTTTAAPGPGAVGGATTTVKPGAAAGVDLSGFLASRAPARPAPPPIILEPPDTGFQGSLPFGAARPGEELEEGEAEAVIPSTRRSTSAISLDDGRPLVPVAGGLILLLLAMHLRVLNRRLKPAAGGDLPIEAPTPPPAAVRRPSPEPEVSEPEVQEIAVAEPGPPDPEMEIEDVPAPVFYDVADDPGWNAEADAETDADADWDAEPDVDWDAEISEWAPVAELPPDPTPEPLALLETEPEPEAEMAREPVEEPEPSVEVAEFDLEPDFRPAPEPDAALPDPDPDEIEVIDVIGPARRPLARAGSR